MIPCYSDCKTMIMMLLSLACYHYIELIIIHTHVYCADYLLIIYTIKICYFLAIAVLLNNNGQYIYKQKGHSISLNCTADGVPRPVIVWRKNGQLILNTNRIIISSTEQSNGFHSNYFPTTSVLTIMDLRGRDNGSYSCQIRNAINTEAVLNTPYVLHVIERKLFYELIFIGYCLLSAPPTNYCLNSPCGKHGKCQSLSNGYVCECSSGYTGINCEQGKFI